MACEQQPRFDAAGGVIAFDATDRLRRKDLVFDVEVAFIYPIVTVFRRWVNNGQGALALGELLVFVLVLVAGLTYVWRKGDLRWIKTVVPPSLQPPGRAAGPGRNTDVAR